MADGVGALKNFLWRLAERCGAQGVTFVVSIILARILDPSVYGTIALVTVFITIMQVFVDSGLGNALIQKKEADDLDFSTVFFFNIVMCLALYGVMFACAPLIAEFYADTELTPVIRVLSLTLIVSGLKNVQQAYVSRHLIFKKFFYATLSGTICAAVCGVACALLGFGVWALVAQNLANVVVGVIVLWGTVKWRPKKQFSFRRLKGLFSYGWKLLVASLIEAVYGDLTQLIIGKLYSSADLAFFNQGKKFPNVFVSNINSAVDSILLPVMSREQDDLHSVRSMTRRSVRLTTYVLAPIMVGIAASGANLITVVLTEKWLECLPFLQIFCIVYLFYPIQSANLNAIKAIGRSDLFLKLEAIKKAMGIVILVISMNYGVLAMAVGVMITRLLYQVVNIWPSKKYLNYGYLDQLKDILPSLTLSLVMGVIVHFCGLAPIGPLLALCLQVIAGCSVYLLLSVALGLDSFKYIVDLAKRTFGKKNGVKND